MSAEPPSGRRLKVCAVSYLNTVPLVWGMLEGAQRNLFDLEFRLPSDCADRLEAGDVDIGIVPAVEFARLGLRLIPGAGIASRGAVRSILLITKTAPGKIRTLAADSSSRTSAVLARIVLERKYGSRPAIVSHSPCLPEMLRTADAALLIGDPALRLKPEALPMAHLDLGAEWEEMTGLPMVFAVWASRTDALPDSVAEAFLESCRFGIAHIDEIARREARRRLLSEELAREYLTRHIVNELGEREYEGMRLFLRYAAGDSDTLVSSGGAVA